LAGFRLRFRAVFWVREAFGLLKLQVCGLGNKKGPEEGPGAPSEFGWQLAIPGGAPGYDYDNKKFCNNITHLAAQASQRLREHNH
jgi:hypothetical protein